MKNQFSPETEEILRLKATEKWLKGQTEFSAKWFHKDGALFKFAVVLSWITGIYNLIMFAAQTLGFWFQAADNTAYLSDARTMTICLSLLVISVVLLFFKKHLPSAVGVILFGTFYFINSRALWMGGVIHESKKLTSLYLFIPSTVIAVIVAVFVAATVIADAVQFRKQYNRLVEKIERTYSSTDGTVTTQEMWDKYVREYVEPAEHEKPKKSLRHKARKSSQEAES